MDESVDISPVAALLAEPARARMLAALMSGKALPAGELAFHANVSPQTASNHLRRLLEGGLIAVETQGRHRYYRLAGEAIATAIEALGNVVPAPRLAPAHMSSQDREIRLLRRCYSHLAGSMAVSIAEALVARRVLAALHDRSWRLTPEGSRWFAELGLPPRILERPEHLRGGVKPCLDWTERRYHLAGPIGVAFFHRLVELKWIADIRRSRAMRLTSTGAVELERRLGLTIPRV
jgi:DNA-binding transcriptional ArsR family regulator